MGLICFDGYTYTYEYDSNRYYSYEERCHKAEVLRDLNAMERKEGEERRQHEFERLEREWRKRELERIEREERWKIEYEHRKKERAERRRKLEAKWKAENELFFITYGITQEEAIAGKPPKYSTTSDQSNEQVIPNTPTAVVHEEVDILIDHTATGNLIEGPTTLTYDVVPVSTTDSPLPVPDNFDEIDDVKVDIGVDPITQHMDLLAESIVVHPRTEPVQFEGSTVHSTILAADLKVLRAQHVYMDPYCQHCSPLDFVIADFSTRAITCFSDVPVLNLSVVDWTYGSKIFVFDPG